MKDRADRIMWRGLFAFICCMGSISVPIFDFTEFLPIFARLNEDRIK
jgi:hypothetical protein